MRRGLTLVELMVAMGAASIVTLLIVSLTAGGLATSRRFLGEEAVFQQAHVVADKLAPLIHETDLSLATYSPDWLAFPTARDADSDRFVTDETTGQPKWSGIWLVYHQSGQKNLRLRRVGLSGKLPIGESSISALCDGSGDILTSSLSSFQLGIETVEVLNDPVAGDKVLPATSLVPGIVRLNYTLEYRDRRGKAQLHPFSDRLEGWNSFAAEAPQILPIPTTTPTPPNEMPIVPMDWKN